MSFWGRLFGSDEATGKLIDNVSNGLDKLWYTDEEKAEDAAQARTEARGVLLDWMKNTQGQNLSRRLIALSITFVWLFLHLVTAIMSVSSIWLDVEMATKIKESAELLGEFNGDIVPAVMLILGFYFAAPHMGSIATAALTRFGERNDKKSNERIFGSEHK